MSKIAAPENEIFGIDSQRWDLLTRQMSDWLGRQYASQQLLHVCGDSAREQVDGRENKLGSFPFVPEPLSENIEKLILEIEHDLNEGGVAVENQGGILQFYFCRSIYLALLHSKIDTNTSIFQNQQSEFDLQKMQAIIVKPLTEALSKIMVKKSEDCGYAHSGGGLDIANAKVNHFSQCLSCVKKESEAETPLERVYSRLSEQKVGLGILSPLSLSQKGDLSREAKALSDATQVSTQEASFAIIDAADRANSPQNTGHVAGKFVDHWNEKEDWSDLELASLDVIGPAVTDAISLLKYDDICQILVNKQNDLLSAENFQGILAYLRKAFDVTAPNHQLKLLFATIELAANHGQDSHKSAIAQTLGQIVHKSQLMNNSNPSGGAQDYTLSYLIDAVFVGDVVQHTKDEFWSFVQTCADVALRNEDKQVLECRKENLAFLLCLKSACHKLSFDITSGYNAIADLLSLSDLPASSLTVSTQKAIKYFLSEERILSALSVVPNGDGLNPPVIAFNCLETVSKLTKNNLWCDKIQSIMSHNNDASRAHFIGWLQQESQGKAYAAEAYLDALSVSRRSADDMPLLIRHVSSQWLSRRLLQADGEYTTIFTHCGCNNMRSLKQVFVAALQKLGAPTAGRKQEKLALLNSLQMFLQEQPFSSTAGSDLAAQPIEDAQAMWDAICKDADLLQSLSEEGNNKARDSAIDLCVGLVSACPQQHVSRTYTAVAPNPGEANRRDNDKNILALKAYLQRPWTQGQADSTTSKTFIVNLMKLPQVYQTLVKIPVIEFLTYIFVLKRLIDNFAREKARAKVQPAADERQVVPPLNTVAAVVSC